MKKLNRSKENCLKQDIKFSILLLSFSRVLTFALFALLIINNIMSYIVPYAWKYIIDELLSEKVSNLSFSVLIMYFVIIIVSIITFNLERLISVKQEEEIQHKFRDYLLVKIIEKDFLGYRNNSYGQIETIINNSISTINNSMYCIGETLLVAPIGLIIGGLYISEISINLFILIAMEVFLVYLAINKGSELRAKAYKNQLLVQSKYFSFLSSVYSAYENIRLLFIKKDILKKHNRVSLNYSISNVEYPKTQIAIDTVISLIKAVLEILTLYLFYLFIQQGRATIGDYIAFKGIKEVIIGSMNGFTQLKLRKKEFDVALNEINKVVPVKAFIEVNKFKSYKKIFDKIEILSLNNIEFSYPNNRICYNFKFTFLSGNKYLLIGENGIGKSTLIRIITNLISPSSGEVLINNEMLLSELDDEVLQQKVAILPQQIEMFEESLIDVILQNGITAYTEHIFKDFNVYEIIMGIQDFGNNGNELLNREFSGGEKKKILLSLIFAKNPDLIILDEPYAELDMKTKEILTKYINKYSKDKIIIMITHEIHEQLDPVNLIKVTMDKDSNSTVSIASTSQSCLGYIK